MAAALSSCWRKGAWSANSRPIEALPGQHSRAPNAGVARGLGCRCSHASLQTPPAASPACNSGPGRRRGSAACVCTRAALPPMSRVRPFFGPHALTHFLWGGEWTASSCARELTIWPAWDVGSFAHVDLSSRWLQGLACWMASRLPAAAGPSFWRTLGSSRGRGSCLLYSTLSQKECPAPSGSAPALHHASPFAPL